MHAPRHYALAIRTRTLLGPVAIAAALAVCSGCGGSESTPQAGNTTGTTTNATTTAGGIDPLEGAGTNPVSAPSKEPEIALLERVAIARHEGYDRIVFQFRNRLPGYRVEYVDAPLREDGSGNLVKVEGNAFVLVRLEPASGFDLGTDEGVMVYKGPRRISGSDAGTSEIREAVRTGDFEAVLSWAVGLEDHVDFRVLPLEKPARLVVDLRNH
jgi:hypothetical protein